MTIRLATSQDVESIRVLYEDLFAHNASQQPQYYTPATAYSDYPNSVVNSDSADLFVAIDTSGTIVGFVHVSADHTPPYDAFVAHGFANIIDLFVCPDFRKQGIGSKLLNAASIWAKSRNLDYVELNVLFENDNAIKFYENMGYKMVSHIMRINL